MTYCDNLVDFSLNSGYERFDANVEQVIWFLSPSGIALLIRAKRKRRGLLDPPSTEYIITQVLRPKASLSVSIILFHVQAGAHTWFVYSCRVCSHHAIIKNDDGGERMTQNFLTAREFLRRAEKLYGEMDRSIYYFEKLAELSKRMTDSITKSGLTASCNDSVAKYAAAMHTRNNELCSRLQAVTEEIREAIHAATSGSVSEMLEERYLCFRSMEEIERHCHWSKRWVIRLHMQGLEAVEKYLEDKQEERQGET